MPPGNTHRKRPVKATTVMSNEANNTQPLPSPTNGRRCRLCRPHPNDRHSGLLRQLTSKPADWRHLIVDLAAIASGLGGVAAAIDWAARHLS